MRKFQFAFYFFRIPHMKECCNSSLVKTFLKKTKNRNINKSINQTKEDNPVFVLLIEKNKYLKVS